MERVDTLRREVLKRIHTIRMQERHCLLMRADLYAIAHHIQELMSLLPEGAPECCELERLMETIRDMSGEDFDDITIFPN